MSVEGKWNVTMDTPIGRQTFVWELQQAAGAWSGTMTAKQGTSALTDIKVEGDALSCATTVNSPMGSIQATFSGAVHGDKLSGTCKTKFGDMSFLGARV